MRHYTQAGAESELEAEVESAGDWEEGWVASWVAGWELLRKKIYTLKPHNRACPASRNCYLPEGIEC